MITAKFVYKDKIFNKFEISGHASESNEQENNLVCAGVSAIVFGILNSLNEKFLKISVFDNLITIKELKYDQENEIILKTLYKSLKTIAQDHKKYLKIIETR